MAEQDYTEYLNYLGKEVTFFTPITYATLPIDSYRKVQGWINGLVLHSVSPSQSEFFVEDNSYSFQDVVFIEPAI